MENKLIDSHAHLDDDRFNEDRETIINSLIDNDVELVLNPGADLETSKKAFELSNKYPFIYAAVGCHPHDSKFMNYDTMDIFRDLSKSEKIIALGEIGLDYYYDNSDRITQKKWFIEQLRLARELDMPIIIHDRDAHEDVLKIIEQEYYDGMRGIMHCYSASAELLNRFIKLGFYISLGGPVTYKNAKVPKQVAMEVPIDRLLIETDSPYLTPEPNRGKRNEPSYVRYVAEEIARLRNLDVEVIAQKTNQNFRTLFNLKKV